MSALHPDVTLSVQVRRDAGPLGRAFGSSDVHLLADTTGEMTAPVAAALLRGIADTLDPPARFLTGPGDLTMSANMRRRAVYTDGTPAPDRCDCGEVPRPVMGQTGMYVLNGVVHRLGNPCYHADRS